MRNVMDPINQVNCETRKDKLNSLRSMCHSFVLVFKVIFIEESKSMKTYILHNNVS